MKTNYFKRQTYFFTLFALLTAGSICIAVDLNYTSLETLLEDFMQPKEKHPEASFADFARALLKIIRNKDQYKNFVIQLEKNINCKNPKLLGLMFKMHGSVFPQKIRSKLLDKNKEADFLDAFNERLKK